MTGAIISRKRMNQLTILTHAVLVGLTPLIPIPVLDGMVKAFFSRKLVRSLAVAHGISLSANEINILAKARGYGCLSGCLFGTAEFLVKSFVRKLIFVLEWRRAIDLVTRTYYVGYLLDYTFRQGWYTPGDKTNAARLQSAIAQAYGGANTGLVKNIVRASFNHSRIMIFGAVRLIVASLNDIAFGRLYRLYRRLRPRKAETAQDVRLENTVAESLERDTPQIRSALDGLIAELQNNLAGVPQEHFTGLEARLEKALKTDGV